jgi:hypothetical protein
VASIVVEVAVVQGVVDPLAERGQQAVVQHEPDRVEQ